MVICNEMSCPICGGNLKHYDRVKRIVRTKNGKICWTMIRRLICEKCHSTHRELPNTLMPFKHYKAEIINGFLVGTLTSYDMDYEDYPCETTIKDWKKAREKSLI